MGIATAPWSARAHSATFSSPMKAISAGGGNLVMLNMLILRCRVRHTIFFWRRVPVARIPDEVLERLKEEVDLAALVTRSGVTLKKAGRDLVGRCPFHDDDTPSLMVTPAKGLWHCMGACQMGGSVIDWVMRAEGVSFRHAVELLREDLVPVGSGPPPKRASTRHLPSPVTADAADA